MKFKLIKKSDSLTKVYYSSFLVMIVIPILLVFAVSIGVLNVMMRDAAISNILSAQGSMLEMLREDVKEASLQLSHFAYVNSEAFMALAASTATDDLALRNENIKELENAFQVAVTPKQDIISAQFYMKNGMITSVKDDLVLSADEIKESAWYQAALEKKNVVSVGTYDTSAMALTRSKQRKWNFVIVAALAPDISLDRSDTIEEVALLYRSDIGSLIRDYERTAIVGRTVITDESGAIIYNGYSGEAGAWYLDQLDTYEDGVYHRKVRQTEADGAKTARYTYVVSSLNSTGWKVVNFLPTSRMTAQLNRIVAILFCVILVLFLLFYLFSRYFLRNILMPVHSVVEGMEQVQAGDLDTHLDPAGQSEIRRMIHSFNRMVRTLKSSITEKEAAQEKKHEAEIRALQSQINPHFLVNTLNSIRFMAQVSKFDGIRRMAESLIRIVSCSFRSNISFYTLGEELEVLDSYVYLMKIRYSEGFEVAYEIDDACRSCRVPRLILQPLVENSIVHGFNGEDIGHLKISAKRTKDGLLLAVWDDGCGMTEEQIRRIYENRERARDDNTSIGLENVIARLKLNFGDSCAVTIKSSKERGTEITLRLPALESEEEKGIR